MKAKTGLGLILAAMLALFLLPAAALADDELTVTGGSEGTDYVYSTSDGARRVTIYRDTPLTISGRPSAASVVINEGVEANLTLVDATINTPAGSAIHLFSGAKLNLTVVGENTLTGTANYAGLDVIGVQTLVITEESTGKLTVTGGTYGAGIGGGRMQSGGTIIIRGGEIIVTGGTDGAGIGGGSWGSNGGVIRIEGGTVSAKGTEWGAGIGGGWNGAGGNITISGGMVVAEGENNGAGIGGGIGGGGGNITINGGTVNATSNGGGAGIGGDGGNITINGGTVNAKGNWGGAGIGGNGGNITINGGTVNAEGKSGGAGIGGGVNGSGAELKLTGGVIFADSATGPMDVGAGTFYQDPYDPGEIIPTEGSVEISGDAALFLKHGTCPTPTTAAHTKQSIAGHAAGSAVYGIPVAWSGNFAAYLRLCRLSYDPNGGNGSLPGAITQHAGTTALVAAGGALSRTGHYALSPWNTAANGGGTDFIAGETFTFPENDIRLFAKWTPYTYTVHYNANGGTGGSTAASTHAYDAPKELTPNGFTQTGYAFAGWATSAVGPVVYKNMQSVLNLTAEDGGAVTLYAQWALPSEPEPLPAPKGTIINCRSGVNVRSGPGTNYPLLGFAPRGSEYMVLEKAGAWYKVDFGGRVGYISAHYLAVFATQAGQGMVVNCRHSVNVRSGPGTRYSILGFAPKGAAYTVIKNFNAWYQIEFNGRTAYISADYFSAGNG